MDFEFIKNAKEKPEVEAMLKEVLHGVSTNRRVLQHTAKPSDFLNP